jgi:hypothetical protein
MLRQIYASAICFGKPDSERRGLAGNQGSRKRKREDHYTAEKVANGVRLEKPVAPLTIGLAKAKSLKPNHSKPTANRNVHRLLEDASFSGAGEGIRTPDPLITNQMLYRLSYASTSGESAFQRMLIPRNPARCPGQLLKVSQWEIGVQGKWGPQAARVGGRFFQARQAGFANQVASLEALAGIHRERELADGVILIQTRVACRSHCGCGLFQRSFATGRLFRSRLSP